MFRPVPTWRLALAAAAAALVAGSAVALGSHGASASSRAGPDTGVVVVSANLGYQNGAVAGTGIVLSSSGAVLTNNHVIRGATSVRVRDVSSGRTYTATVAGYDVSDDIALLKLADAHGLKTATIGNSAHVRVGDRVTAIGNAGGTGVLSTTVGKLTGLRKSITVSGGQGDSSRLTGLIETSARLEPGDSGGPLLDSRGRVIGIDAAASGGYRSQAGGGDGYAIPINTAISIAGEIRAGHRSATVHVGPTAFLGVGLGQAGSYGQEMPGALVENVVQGSAADRAGVVPGDLITAFGGRQVASPAGLQKLLFQASPGRTFRLSWIDRYGDTNRAAVRPLSGPPQ